ncbi:hypothetical protein C357_22505 [Citreicella sp. 357]|nr:hypothetical protein C357_22505 [Citreicella sp. 357]
MTSVICVAVFIAASVTHRASQAQLQLHEDIVLRGADAIGLSFNTALKREWSSLNAIARGIGNASQKDIDGFMDAVVQAGGQVAWAGFANLDGTIISGSNRLREGEDVSERRWFREGLHGATVGNVHSSDSLMYGGNSDQASILNLSTQVLNNDTGEVVGVLIYSLRMDWILSLLAQARDQLHIDVVVQTREGATIIDTRGNVGPLPDAIVRQASLGQSTAGSFRLLDQSEGLYAFTSDFISDTLPDFGWDVFAVLDRDNLTDVLPGLLRSLITSVAIATLFVLVTTLLALRILLRPIESLTKTATLVANGEYEYPIESRSSNEAIMLSRALVRIQRKLAHSQPLNSNGGSLSQEQDTSRPEKRPSEDSNDLDEPAKRRAEACPPTRLGGRS